MPYTAPSTVAAGQTYTSAAHNVIVNDIIDHESRLLTTQNTQYPYRNILINGAMQIAQRGTSVSGITATGYYTADRWQIQTASAGTWTQAVSADSPTGSGFRNSLRMTCSATAASAAGTLLIINQSFEGQTLQHIKKGTANAQQLTLQFWVKSNRTGTYVSELYDADNTRSVSGAYTINAIDTWEQKTITFPADTTGSFANANTGSLTLSFWCAAGTTYSSGTLATAWGASVGANRAAGQTRLGTAASDYIAITGVQLEPGAVASPYEFVLYQDELRRCQRYYWRNSSVSGTKNYWLGSSGATNSTFYLIACPVPMRVGATSGDISNMWVQDLTGTVYNTGAWDFNSYLGFNTPNVGMVVYALSAPFTVYRPYVMVGGTGSYIGFSAEL